MGVKIITLLFFMAFVALTAAFGSLFMPGEWYQALYKPSWNPPSWVFGPVWSVLYVLIAVSGWMIFNSEKENPRGVALSWWLGQLVLNAAWSWMFFGLHRPGWAFFEIMLLLAAIVLTMRAFHAIKPLAALLLAPYLAWVSFAAFLNFTLWTMNGGGFGSIFGG